MMECGESRIFSVCREKCSAVRLSSIVTWWFVELVVHWVMSVLPTWRNADATYDISSIEAIEKKLIGF